ncbi:hypothetical protein JCM16161A_03610 [Vulcanisaeta sp. JCM 16161]|nr:hypothetical protein [Vulcanisaeta sp. JCM 16161]
MILRLEKAIVELNLAIELLKSDYSRIAKLGRENETNEILEKIEDLTHGQ